MGDTVPTTPAVRLRDRGRFAPRELAAEIEAVGGAIESACYEHGQHCACGMLQDERREYHDADCACRRIAPEGAERIESLLTDLARVAGMLRACITTEPDMPVELLHRYRVMWRTVALAESPLGAAHVAEGTLHALDALNRPRLFVFDGRGDEHEVDLQTGEALTRPTE